MVVKPVNLIPLFNLLPLKMYFFMVRTWSDQARSQLSCLMSYVEKHFKEKWEMLPEYKVVVYSNQISSHNTNPIAKDNSLWLRQEFPSECAVPVYSPLNPFTISVLTSSWNTILPSGCWSLLFFPEVDVPGNSCTPAPGGQLLSTERGVCGASPPFGTTEAGALLCPELPHGTESPSVRRYII